MALNYIWIFFFLIAFVVALGKLVIFQDYKIFETIVKSSFEMAKTGFNISLNLTGVLALWLGIMKIGEKAGIVKVLARIVGPFFNKLFPELPKDCSAYGSIIMNLSANMLGLDNAATPMGLKAMEEMQQYNKSKDKASNAQIMFLVLNTSGLTLIPVSVMVYRYECGAANPADIFIPILLATYFSTIVGLISVSIVQKINLFNKTILAYLGGISVFIIAIIWYFSGLEKEQIQIISNIASNSILFGVIIAFIVFGFVKKINVYDAFVEGAKDGFGIAVKIIPFLIAMLVAIGVFRASGAMDIMIEAMRYLASGIGLDTDFIEALPTALMKPLSGSGARGMMLETMKTYGADSFAGRMSSTLQGATDTTFYIIAVYFGAVGIKNTRHAIGCGLLADLAGIIAAIFISYLFFH